MTTRARLAYADPPYPGCAKLYASEPTYAGEVDHAEFVARLQTYDGFVLHTSSVALAEVLSLFAKGEVRVMAWVKPFASAAASAAAAASASAASAASATKSP